MVRDNADPGSAFVLAGRDADGKTVLAYRQRADEGVVTFSFEPPRARPWLRLVVGRDTVYVADADEVAAANPGAWKFLAAVKIELAGGASQQRRADLGGVFLSDGSATYSDLYQTEHLFWSERTTTTDLAVQSPPGSWTALAPSPQHFAESTTLLSRDDAGSPAHLDFPLDIKAAGHYRLYVHAVDGNQSPVRAALVLGGVQQAVQDLENEPAGLNSWLPLSGGEPVALSAGQIVAVRLLDAGAPGSVVVADAARAVLVDAPENGVFSYPGWIETPGDRIVQSAPWGAANDLRRNATALHNTWNAGAYSANVLVGDGAFKFRFIGNELRMQAGFTDYPWGNDPANIDHRFTNKVHSSATGRVQALGGGSSAEFAYVNGDWLEIERIGSQILFRRNGALLHFSTLPAPNPLYIDTIFFDLNARVYGSRILGHWADPSAVTDLDADGAPDTVERWVIDADPEDGIQSIHDVDMNADPDGDGLTNQQEYDLNPQTNPTKADTDGDGLPDGWEVAEGFAPLDPADGALDADGDGLANLEEFQLGTNPFETDSDGDGLPDGWEVLHGFNPLSAPGGGESGLDSDNDGLTNAQEFAAGTDPQNPDSDSDGLEDGEEVLVHFTNPLEPDSDFDGLSDNFEVHDELGFDPNNPDSDGDGVRDWHEWRILTFDPGDAFAAQAQILPGDDFDNDGVSNLHESEDGTDPADLDDYFTPVAFDRLFGAVAGAAWTVESNGGIESSRLLRTAALPEPAGGISHHEARDGTRVRFQFLPLDPASGAADQILVGFSHRGHPPYAPLPEAHYAAAIRLDPTGKARLLVYGSEIPGGPSFDLAESDLVELRLETGENGAAPRFLHVEVNQIPVTDEPIPLPEGPAGFDSFLWDHDKNAATPEEPAPLAVVVQLPANGAGVHNLRYRRIHDPDRDDDGLPDRWEQQILDAYPLFGDVAAVLPGGDADDDDLTNLEEYQLGTDPTNPDTDGDGMEDGWEDTYGLDPLDPSDAEIDPAVPGSGDLDGNGLSNRAEFDLGTRPDQVDSDGDGLSDGWEVEYGFNPLSPPGDLSDAAGHADDDGLTNLQEFQFGSDPNAAASSADGFSDSWKHQYGLDPNVALDPADDPDNDGLGNALEHQLGTDPTNPDTDGDGIPDGWEHAHGAAYDPPAGSEGSFDPADGLDPLDLADAALDPDDDGFSNLEEFLAGTDPHDPASNPHNIDSDGDGMPDFWEMQYGLDPNDPADADYDRDYDGLTNLREYQHFAATGAVLDPQPKWRTVTIEGGLPEWSGGHVDPHTVSPSIGSLDALGRLARIEILPGQNGAPDEIFVRRWDPLGFGAGSPAWNGTTLSLGTVSAGTRHLRTPLLQNLSGMAAAGFQIVGASTSYELRILDESGALQVPLTSAEGWSALADLRLAESGFVAAVGTASDSAHMVVRWRRGESEILPLPPATPDFAPTALVGRRPEIVGLSERGELLVRDFGSDPTTAAPKHRFSRLAPGSDVWTVLATAPLALGPYGFVPGETPPGEASAIQPGAHGATAPVPGYWNQAPKLPAFFLNRRGDWSAFGWLGSDGSPALDARAVWTRNGQAFRVGRGELLPAGAEVPDYTDGSGSPVAWSSHASGTNRHGDLVGGIVVDRHAEFLGESGAFAPVEGYGSAFLLQRGQEDFTFIPFVSQHPEAEFAKLARNTRFWAINGAGNILASAAHSVDLVDENDIT